MPGKYPSSAEATLVRGPPDFEPAHCVPTPTLYCNPCQGIPPVVIDVPRVFFAAQAMVCAFGLTVAAVILLIFEV